MTEERNRISTLLGVSGNSQSGIAGPNPGVRTGLAQSPLSNVNAVLAGLEDATYGTVFHTGFSSVVIPAGLTLTEEGTTTAAASYAGSAVITSDDVAAKTDQLTTGLNWQANRQATGAPLIFQCRWKSGATITASEYWIGLTDAAPDTDPIALSTTSTFTTSVPSDGVYMGYSATPTSGAAFTTGGNLHTALAFKGDANTLVGTGGGVFAANTFYTYRIEVDADGTARYYLNGTLLFTQATALTATVPLAAMVCASPRTTVSAVITCKYLFVAGA